MHGAYPGNIGRGMAKLLDIVGLEDAEGIDVAPCVEDDKMGDDGLGPGLEAAVRRGSRSMLCRGCNGSRVA